MPLRVPKLLARCGAAAEMQTLATDGSRAPRKCGGLLLNRMNVRTCAGLGVVHNGSFLSSGGFAVGGLE